VVGLNKYVTLSDSVINENVFKAVFHSDGEEVPTLTPTIIGLPVVLDTPEIEKQTSQGSTDNDSIATTISTNGKICNGRDVDIHEMLADFWPCISYFLKQQPEHDHSIQWTKWFTNGLTSSSGLTEVKRMMGIDVLSQLYLILCYSPAINQVYDIEWDHKIRYTQKLSLDLVTLTIHRIEPDKYKGYDIVMHNIYFMVDMDDKFQIFHKLVCSGRSGHFMG
jgi:hypothetical protein